MTSLIGAVTALLDDAIGAYAGSPAAGRLEAARARLDEPLRVAVAGKVKAGKSTLLNALVGERLAPTDAGECTRVVTWYVGSHTSRVTLHPRVGDAAQAPFRRDDGAITVDLGGRSTRDVDHLVVEWPSPRLVDVSLIDTPGIDSLSNDVSARSYAFLTPGDDHETLADAVVYLMRHLHSSDVRFLEAFHDDEVVQATPVNAIGVLSRADEIGVGRLDAMDTATRIAGRYRTDPLVRRVCQTVVPVAGLLAETASTLRQDEFAAVARLTSASEADLDSALLSADRFADGASHLPVDAAERAALLRRLGLYGVRLSISLVRTGTCRTGPELAAELRRTSGIERLEAVLRSQFAHRRDLLKARAGMAALDAVLRDLPDERLAIALERLEASAHELTELRLLNALAAGALALDEDGSAARLLGAAGPGARARLGLDDSAGEAEVREAVATEIARWHRRAEHPMASREEVEAARVLIRTCEGLLALSA